MLAAAQALPTCSAEELFSQLRAVQAELARRGLFPRTPPATCGLPSGAPGRAEWTLQLLLAAAPLPIVCVDAEARVTGWNPAAQTVFGWSAEEVLGRELPYVPAGEESAADALFQAGLAGRIAGPVRIRRRRKDGRLLDLQLWPTFLRDDEGRLLLAFGIYEDVTDQLRAEAALRESEQRYLSLYENNPSMYFTLSPSGTVLSVNRFGAEHLGYRQEDLLGGSVLEIFAPEDRGTVLAQLETCTKCPLETFTWEIGKVCKDGSRLWVRERARAIVGARGEVTILIVCEDITDRKRAEAVLQDSERRLRLIVDNEPECVKIVDRDGRLQTMNPAGLSMVEAPSEDEIRGRSVLDLVHPQDRAAYEQFHNAVAEGRSTSLSFRMLGLRGTERVVDSHAVPLKDARGVVTGILSVTRDMTERQRAAEERERISQDLHDTILQSLYAVGMQLEASKLTVSRSPRQSKAHTSQAVEHLNRLVREVRQFISLLRREHTSSLHLGQALRQLAASLSPNCAAPPEVDIDDTVVSAIEPEHAEQLLSIAREAASNSARHSGARRRWLRLIGTPASIRLEIGDDGVGFNRTRKRKSGHGLANMAARARRIRASFSLDTRPGQGTCITVDLPRRPA
jgi:PAS domain S-box-containing protein